MKAEPIIDTFTVDNPAEYAERVAHPRIEAVRALRDDPIGQMHARGHLGRRDSDEALGRLKRARLFQETWEATGRGRIKSVDLAGASGSDPTRRSGITDRQIAASKRLAHWQVALGLAGFDLLVAVLIDKRTVAEVARQRHGVANKANVTYAGRRLRECLDAL